MSALGHAADILCILNKGQVLVLKMSGDDVGSGSSANKAAVRFGGAISCFDLRDLARRVGCLHPQTHNSCRYSLRIYEPLISHFLHPQSAFIVCARILVGGENVTSRQPGRT